MTSLLPLLLLLVPAAPEATQAATPEKPNIVFIYADDWGWGDLSCHGHAFLKTPHLDRLAAEGTDFQQFNVLNPVCSPSRTAVMTGQFPARWSVHQHFAAPAQNHSRGMPDWLDPAAPMLPRFLKAAGYATGHFGKWHLTSEMVPDGPAPTAYGFDEFKVFNYSKPNAQLLETGSNAAAFIRAHKNEPFYVNVWLHESHTPHVPTKESLARWEKLGEREKVYAAVITDGDNEVGQVLDALRELDLEKNTIVIFSSDNGPEKTGAMPQKRQDAGYGTYYSVGTTGGLRGRKRSLFEGGVRVPFIVRWPGHSPAGKQNMQTVFTAIDLLPTLCAAAGVALPPTYKPDGENLLAALKGEEVKRTKPIYWEWRGPNPEPNWWPRLAVREGDWKLLLTADGKRAELYQEADDRAETKNVAAANAEVVSRLTKMVQAWKAELPQSPPAHCLTKSAAGKEPKEKRDE